MRRKLIAALISVALVASALTLSSCYERKSSSDTERHMDTNQVFVYVDKDTGVNYLLWNKGYGAAMIVRLNADGSVRVSEVE